MAEIYKEFKQCPICYSKETIARKAIDEEGSYPKGTFASLTKFFVPTQDVMKISLPTTKVLLVHYDVCAKCGTQYCTRVEKTTVPTSAIMQQLGKAMG